MTRDRHAVRARLVDDEAGDAIIVAGPEGPSLRTDTDDTRGAPPVLRPMGGGRHVLLDDASRSAVVLGAAVPVPGGGTVREVLVDGFRFEVRTESDYLAALRERANRNRPGAGHAARHEVRAIIPGKVVAVSVAVGDAVAAGAQLLVVEAMKMQNELRAPRDGTIERVGVVVGQNLEIGDVLVVIG
jgi:acetyl/propionyl-CoA carboxylase alpha subunit